MIVLQIYILYIIYGIYYVVLLPSYTLKSKFSLLSKKIKGNELASKPNLNNESNTQKWLV